MEGVESKLVCVLLAKDQREAADQLEYFSESIEENETFVECDRDGKQVLIWIAWPGCEHKLPKIIDALFVCPGRDEKYNPTVEVDTYAKEKLSHSVHIIYRDEPTQNVFEPGRVKFVPQGYENTDSFIELLFRLNEELEEAIKKVFVSFDVDNSGFIDSNELKNASRDLGHELSEEELTQVLQELDENRDGKISYNEFRNWWKSGRSTSGRTMKRLTSLQAKAKKLIDRVAASTELIEEIYGKEDSTLVSFRVAFNQGPQIESPGLKANIDFFSGPSDERDSLVNLIGLEESEKDIFAVLTFKLKEGKDPEQAKDKLNTLVSKFFLRMITQSGRSTRQLLKGIEYRLRTSGNFLYLYFILSSEYKGLSEFKAAWNRVKFAFPTTVQQNVSAEANFKNGVNDILGRESTPVLLSLFEHFRVKVQANIWSQLSEYGLRIIEGQLLDSPTEITSLINSIALLSNNLELELNTYSLVNFSEKLLEMLIGIKAYDDQDIQANYPRNFLSIIAEIYDESSKQIPALKNVLAFLKEYINTDLIQVFANVFSISAKLKIEGEGILGLFP